MRGIDYMLAKWIEAGKKVVTKDDIVLYAGSPSTFYFWRGKLIVQGVLRPTGEKGTYLLDYGALQKWYGYLFDILKNRHSNQTKPVEGSA